jgi:2-desacetyl-2-hydroxyethyl bacteriochlorophyllide A dehydrogenase
MELRQAKPLHDPGPEVSDMYAMVLTDERAIELQRRPLPASTLGPGEVLLDVDLCGICGSDLHASDLTQVYTAGHILGHEAVGRVRAVGPGVSGWRVGQRASVNPNGNTCGVCEYCRAGQVNHCVQATLELAVGLQADGGLAPRLVTSAKTLHAIPEHMGRVESGWIEPAATALRAVRLAGNLEARSVLVVGGGPIGHVVCRLARHFGAATVWLAEPSAERRRFAEASKVDGVFDPTVDRLAVEALHVDVVIECSGNEHGTRMGLAALRPFGTMIVLGGGVHPGIDPMTVLLKEIHLQGSFTYIGEFDEVAQLLADGHLEVADLTTEIVPIEDAPRAFELLRAAGTMKVLVAPNG